MTTQPQQMLAITGDDQIGLRCDCGGDDLIVIDIAGHDPRLVSGRDQLDDLGLKQYLVCHAHGFVPLAAQQIAVGRFVVNRTREKEYIAGNDAKKVNRYVLDFSRWRTPLVTRLP
jgi:hypothetical protein